MDFTCPWDSGDVTFIVESKKIYANKAVLGMYSEVFSAMFTSDFKEKKMTEIPLPDKKFDDFLVFMKIVHPLPRTCVDDTNVESLLHLAHEYQIHQVVERCEKVLVKQPRSIHNLILADKFSRTELRQAFFNYLREVPYSKLEFLEKEPEIEQVNKNTRLQLVQYTLMFQKPSIENLLLGEKYDVPEVYEKCMKYLKDTPLSHLKPEAGFTELKPEILVEVLTHKFERLYTDVSRITSWGELDTQRSCSGGFAYHYTGSDRYCPGCEGYRFRMISQVINKY